MQLKRCHVCGDEKNIELFAQANNGGGDRRAAYCRDCGATLTPQQKAAIVSKLWRANNRAQHHASVVRRAYGITGEQYAERLKEQNSVCAACGEPENITRKTGQRQRLCVDHNHQTGAVRALMCLACNTLLGHYEKDPKRMKRVIKYLKRHGEI